MFLKLLREDWVVEGQEVGEEKKWERRRRKQVVLGWRGSFATLDVDLRSYDDSNQPTKSTCPPARSLTCCEML